MIWEFVWGPAGGRRWFWWQGRDWRLETRYLWSLLATFYYSQTSRTVRSGPRGVLCWQKTNKLHSNWKVFSDYLNKNSFSGNVDLLKIFRSRRLECDAEEVLRVSLWYWVSGKLSGVGNWLGLWNGLICLTKRSSPHQTNCCHKTYRGQ